MSVVSEQEMEARRVLGRIGERNIGRPYKVRGWEVSTVRSRAPFVRSEAPRGNKATLVHRPQTVWIAKKGEHEFVRVRFLCGAETFFPKFLKSVPEVCARCEARHTQPTTGMVAVGVGVKAGGLSKERIK